MDSRQRFLWGEPPHRSWLRPDGGKSMADVSPPLLAPPEHVPNPMGVSRVWPVEERSLARCGTFAGKNRPPAVHSHNK